MSCSFGEKFKITIFGQSHSEAIGVVIDGIPAGVKLDLEKIKIFMERRSPANKSYATKRNEADEFEIVSGVVDGVTCGAPLCAIIKNTDAKSADYSKIRAVPRPSHADFTAFMKYNGFNDVRGGGNFSGRMTAPICFAGAVAAQLLEEKGIFIGAHIEYLPDTCDEKFDAVNVTAEDLNAVKEKDFPVIKDKVKALMLEEIGDAAKDGNSIGGCIECAVVGLPVGIGEPIFDGLESEISRAVFSVPAVKGIEFGRTLDRGSDNNDAFTVADGQIKTETNNHGGILGGLSSGMPLIFHVTVKPTPSIGKPQKTVNLETMKPTKLEIGGRHDPCIVPRAVPCIEAAAALAIINLI